MPAAMVRASILKSSGGLRPPRLRDPGGHRLDLSKIKQRTRSRLEDRWEMPAQQGSHLCTAFRVRSSPGNVFPGYAQNVGCRYSAALLFANIPLVRAFRGVSNLIYFSLRPD